MKTKYFLIYVFVGIAFLAASAWVFFTRGENAKAIRVKYKLGGILLTCLAMLSVASCGEVGGPGRVMCYDPVIEERTDNLISVSIQSTNSSYRYYEMSPGDIFHVEIQAPTYPKYMLRVILNNKEGTELQREELVITDAETHVFDIPLSTDVTYRGEACVQVQGVENEDPEELSQMAYGIQIIHIL
jgi:hypothetical protein